MLNNPPLYELLHISPQVTQSSKALMVASCVKTTLEIVQKDQANALGYSIVERYYGRRVEMYL